MKNKQNGFIGIVVVLIIFATAGGGVYFYNKNKVTKNTKVIDVPVTIKNKSDEAPIFEVMDEKELDKLVAKKYGGNTAAINKQIKVNVQAALSSFVIEAEMKKGTEGSYENVCTGARSFIEANIKTHLDRNSDFMNALGISMSSYTTAQIICKANANNFIITMPITLEDGNPTKVCSSPTTLSLIGDANYETYTCVSK